ncbi:MAG: crotonase/enoyl-CoA hydratase family protein [Novosphingobium sp.]
MTVDPNALQTVTVELADKILIVTLNRPDKRNALSSRMKEEVIATIEAAADDPGAHVVVIKGAGKSFCSGYDIGPSGGRDNAHGGAAVEMSLPQRTVKTVASAREWTRIWNAPIPVIAQIHGHCLAGGTDLALHCDLVLTADDAMIGFPALRMGGTPPANMWLYHLGVQWSKRLLFTGDTFTGRMAEKIGFALEAVPSEELDARVMALARRIAAMGKDIVAINKHVLNRGVDLMGRTALQEIAGSMDSIANQAAEMAAFHKRVAEIGLAEAFKERDAPFAEGVPLDIAKS